MKNNKKNNKTTFVPIIVVLILILSISIFIKTAEEPITIDTILKYTPNNVYIAIIVLLSFFALKSLSIVFPLSVLYLASGILFSPFLAVVVSTLGLWITITVPYVIGYFSGKDINSYMLEKYPKIEKIAVLQSENTFFLCFITRIVGFLPADVLSMYFGICRIPYGRYALAGVVGSLLSIITTTLLGDKLADPFSWEFVIILICRIALVIASFLFNHILRIKEKNANKKRR